MIVVRITGGLGNQLYGYAYGLALAKRNNTDLWLDLSEYKKPNSFRQLELRNIFPNVKHSQAVNCLKYLRHAKENTFGCDPRLKTLPDFHYVSGYFQSYKYFDHIKQELDFTKSIHFDYVRELVKATGADTAIHIRRGDYLKSINHYVLPDSYYKNALNKINADKIVIFSDMSAKEKSTCLSGIDRNFLQWESIDAVHDLAAMSFFKNIVMANSTYSFWAAYLSNARVICPARYFSKDVNMSDFYLPAWEQI